MAAGAVILAGGLALAGPGTSKAQRPVSGPASPAAGSGESVESDGATAGPPAPAPERIPELYGAYARMLGAHVVGRPEGDTAVRYVALRADRADLDAFLARIAATDPAALPSEADRLAFWINAYNAFAIKAVADNPSIRSIRDLGTWVPPQQVWDKKWFTVNGRKVSLNHVEHEVLRKEFREPRIHFAIVCASRSCPDLMPWPFVAERLEDQLAHVLRRFLSQSKGAVLAGDRKALRLSSIFKWFSGDFEGAAGSIVKFVWPHLPAPMRAGLQPSSVEVSFLPYDWNLNDAP